MPAEYLGLINPAFFIKLSGATGALRQVCSACSLPEEAGAQMSAAIPRQLTAQGPQKHPWEHQGEGHGTSSTWASGLIWNSSEDIHGGGGRSQVQAGVTTLGPAGTEALVVPTHLTWLCDASRMPHFLHSLLPGQRKACSTRRGDTGPGLPRPAL